jgi:protein-disulfide isomerase
MSKKSADATRQERTAALMQEQARAERRRQFVIVGSVMAVLAVIVGVGLFVMSRADQTSSSTVAASDYSFGVGDPEAPVNVVIYEDFICPACGYFESVTHEKLKQAADEGKVYVEYRPFNFLERIGPYSGEAANAFRAVWVTAGEDAAL